MQQHSATFLTAPDSPPIKLVPPFKTLTSQMGWVEVDLCDVEAGHLYYLGVQGGEHCAAYTVRLEYGEGDGCHPLEVRGLIRGGRLHGVGMPGGRGPMRGGHVHGLDTLRPPHAPKPLLLPPGGAPKRIPAPSSPPPPRPTRGPSTTT